MVDAQAAGVVSPSLCPLESRVLIARLPSQATCELGVDTQGCLLHLKNPKTGAKSCYMMINETLQEIHWFKEQFSSWFIGNHVLEDGSLYMCTPMDPIFLLLPILDEARMKRADDVGKFRLLEEILYVEGYPGYMNLIQLSQHLLDAVCEVRDIGTSKYYRLDDSKVLSWLCCKVKLTMEGLDTLEGYDTMLEEAKEAHAIGLLGDYLIKDSPWLVMLCHHLGVDLPASKKCQFTEIYESHLFCEPKSSVAKRDEKVSTGKVKTHKGSTAGMRKVTQFFALER